MQSETKVEKVEFKKVKGSILLIAGHEGSDTIAFARKLVPLIDEYFEISNCAYLNTKAPSIEDHKRASKIDRKKRELKNEVKQILMNYKDELELISNLVEKVKTGLEHYKLPPDEEKEYDENLKKLEGLSNQIKDKKTKLRNELKSEEEKKEFNDFLAEAPSKKQFMINYRIEIEPKFQSIAKERKDSFMDDLEYVLFREKWEAQVKKCLNKILQTEAEKLTDVIEKSRFNLDKITLIPNFIMTKELKDLVANIATTKIIFFEENLLVRTDKLKEESFDLLKDFLRKSDDFDKRFMIHESKAKSIAILEEKELESQTKDDTIHKVLDKCKRVSKRQYYMNVAHMAKERSNCLKRSVGAVIVKYKKIIGIGYNGTPCITGNCMEGACNRCLDSRSSSGIDLDKCLCVHAEENAILNCGTDKTMGATVYTTHQPCYWCTKILMQAGVAQVIYDYEYYEPAAHALQEEQNKKYQENEELKRREEQEKAEGKTVFPKSPNYFTQFNQLSRTTSTTAPTQLDLENAVRETSMRFTKIS